MFLAGILGFKKRGESFEACVFIIFIFFLQGVFMDKKGVTAFFSCVLLLSSCTSFGQESKPAVTEQSEEFPGWISESEALNKVKKLYKQKRDLAKDRKSHEEKLKKLNDKREKLEKKPKSLMSDYEKERDNSKLASEYLKKKKELEVEQKCLQDKLKEVERKIKEKNDGLEKVKEMHPVIKERLEEHEGNLKGLDKFGKQWAKENKKNRFLFEKCLDAALRGNLSKKQKAECKAILKEHGAEGFAKDKEEVQKEEARLKKVMQELFDAKVVFTK